MIDLAQGLTILTSPNEWFRNLEKSNLLSDLVEQLLAPSRGFIELSRTMDGSGYIEPQSPLTQHNLTRRCECEMMYIHSSTIRAGKIACAAFSAASAFAAWLWPLHAISQGCRRLWHYRSLKDAGDSISALHYQVATPRSWSLSSLSRLAKAVALWHCGTGTAPDFDEREGFLMRREGQRLDSIIRGRCPAVTIGKAYSRYSGSKNRAADKDSQ